MTGPRVDPRALDIVEDHLARLASGLGPWDRTTRDTVAEMRDGLLCATERYVAEGRPAVDAARAAVRLCGAVEQVGPLMRADAVATRARGTALALLSTGPVAAVAWVATVVTSPASPWRVGAASPWRAVGPWLGLGVLLTVTCALLANAAASTPARQSPRLARGAALAAAVACAGTDLAALAGVAAWSVATPGVFAWPVAVAVAVSGARMVFAGRRAGHLRRTLATAGSPAGADPA